MRRWAMVGTLSFGILGAACGDSTRLTPLAAKDLPPLIESHRGKKVVLVNVWATWCVPCIEEFPDLVKIRKSHKNRLALIFISADFPEQENRVREFLKNQGVDWETYLKTGPDEAFISALSSRWTGALPATFLYNMNGEQIAFWEGVAEMSAIQDSVATAIQP